MKIFHETEDTLAGILLGVLLLLPIFTRIAIDNMLIAGVCVLLLILNLLDIRHCIQEFRGYAKACTIAIIMNAADITINLALLSKILNTNISFITENFVPFVSQNMLIIGVYLVAGNLVYFLLHKKLE